jgi:hypothetical protein
MSEGKVESFTRQQHVLTLDNEEITPWQVEEGDDVEDIDDSRWFHFLQRFERGDIDEDEEEEDVK